MDSSLSTSRPARAAVSNQQTSNTSKTSKPGTAGTEPEPDWSDPEVDEHEEDLEVIRSLRDTMDAWNVDDHTGRLLPKYPDLVTAYQQLRRYVDRALFSNNSRPSGSGRRETRNASRPDTNGRPVAPAREQQDVQVQTRPAPDAQAGHSQATLSRPQQPQLSSIWSEPASTLSAPRRFVTLRGHQYEIPISKRERRAHVDAPAEEDDTIPTLNDDGIATINTAPGDQHDSSRNNDGMERSSSRRSARVLNRSLGATPHAAAESSSSRMTPHNPSSPAYGISRKRRRVDEEESEDEDDNDDEHPALHGFESAQTFGDDDITAPETDNEATLEVTAKRKKSRGKMKRGPPKWKPTVPEHDCFVRVPGVAVGQSQLQPMSKLPPATAARLQAALDELINADFGRAATVLRPENRASYLDSGRCLALHMFNRSNKTQGPPETSCQTCASYTGSRPCVRLEVHPSDPSNSEPALVFYPRPTDRRATKAVSTETRFWLGS